MKAIIKGFTLVASLAVSTSLAHATTIAPGNISIGGPAVYTATSLTFNDPSLNADLTGVGSVIIAGSGGLSNFAFGDAVTLDNLSTVGFTGGDLFTVTNAADQTLTYYLQNISSFTILPDGDLDVAGTGYFEEAGFSNTEANINVSSQGGENVAVSFSATSAITPEPNSLLLLGTGLLFAAEVARRKFATKASL